MARPSGNFLATVGRTGSSDLLKDSSSSSDFGLREAEVGDHPLETGNLENLHRR